MNLNTDPSINPQFKIVRRRIEAERIAYESTKRFKKDTRPEKLSSKDVEAKILQIAQTYYLSSYGNLFPGLPVPINELRDLSVV